MTKLQRIEELENQVAKLKAEIERDEKPDYPYVGVADDGLVSFFRGPKDATHIHIGETGAFFGLESKGIAEHHFKPFTGTIEYKNGKPV